ncbi:MAG: substrate-binding domain-containing protein [Anaeromyxobacteraceae bacterium]
MWSSTVQRLAWLVVACAVVAPPSPRAAEVVRINGAGSCLDLMNPLLAGFAASHPDVRVDMRPPLGSSGAMMALLAGAVDLAVVSRPVNPEEEARGARPAPYGKTPLIVVAHADVRVEGVTTAELEEIYSGTRPTWPGGAPIRVILRPDADTNTKVLRRLSPGMERAEAAARRQPWALVAVTDPESDEMVARTPGAIGVAALTSLIVAKLPVRRLSLDGVVGTVASAAAGRYRLMKDVIFVTSAASSPAARAIVAFARSAEGRAIAAKSGVLVTAPVDGAP